MNERGTRVNAVTETTKWLVLVYKIPSEPSRNRLQIWRRVRKSGAIYIQDGVCMLPSQSTTLRVFLSLAQRIEAFGGQSLVLESVTCGQVGHNRLVGEFNKARNREYAELHEQTEHFMKEVDKETQSKNFSSEEVEEIEQDLLKLKRWTMRIRARDWFGASLGSEVNGRLELCERALQDFTAAAYEAEQKATQRSTAK